MQPAYFAVKLITAVKYFMIHAPGVDVLILFSSSPTLRQTKLDRLSETRLKFAMKTGAYPNRTPYPQIID